MYEETNDIEFNVDFSKVFEQRQQAGSDMTMAKKKNPKKPTKKLMVDAIINLEEGLHSVFQKVFQIENALREYIAWRGKGNEFQKYLNDLFIIASIGIANVITYYLKVNMDFANLDQLSMH